MRNLPVPTTLVLSISVHSKRTAIPCIHQVLSNSFALSYLSYALCTFRDPPPSSPHPVLKQVLPPPPPQTKHMHTSPHAHSLEVCLYNTPVGVLPTTNLSSLPPIQTYAQGSSFFCIHSGASNNPLVRCFRRFIYASTRIFWFFVHP